MEGAVNFIEIMLWSIVVSAFVIAGGGIIVYGLCEAVEFFFGD